MISSAVRLMHPPPSRNQIPTLNLPRLENLPPSKRLARVNFNLSTGNRLIFPLLFSSQRCRVAVFPGFHNALESLKKSPTPNRSASFLSFFSPLSFFIPSRVKGDEKSRVESTRRACYRSNARNKRGVSMRNGNCRKS